jgi:hypothetical protein
MENVCAVEVDRAPEPRFRPKARRPNIGGRAGTSIPIRSMLGPSLQRARTLKRATTSFDALTRRFGQF